MHWLRDTQFQALRPQVQPTESEMASQTNPPIESNTASLGIALVLQIARTATDHACELIDRVFSFAGRCQRKQELHQGAAAVSEVTPPIIYPDLYDALIARLKQLPIYQPDQVNPKVLEI